jgi:ABC-type transport system involved in cytochrome bd biosynthesis fused ATPase/permease subunit
VASHTSTINNKSTMNNLITKYYYGDYGEIQESGNATSNSAEQAWFVKFL